jgi:hypothetical protein
MKNTRGERMKTFNTTEENTQLLEQYAERMALSVISGANFTQCLKINGLAPLITIVTPKGQHLTLHGRDLCNERTWKKFLLTQGQSLDLLQLIGVVDQLALRYRGWLLTCYTQRYQAISTPTEREWFEQVTQLVIVHKIMERKYEAFVYEQCDSFADPWVAEEMTVLMRINMMTREIASTLYRLVKQPGMAQQFIEQLYETHAAYLEKRPQRARRQLAPLPPGTMMPLAFLSNQEGM